MSSTRTPCLRCKMYRYITARRITSPELPQQRVTPTPHSVRRKPLVPGQVRIDWDTQRPHGVQEVYRDLATATEVAAFLGVKKERMRRWIERRDDVNCPTPVRELLNIHVYSLREWHAWYQVWKVTRSRLPDERAENPWRTW